MKSRIKAIQQLGELFRGITQLDSAPKVIKEACQKAQYANGWFTEESLLQAMTAWGTALKAEHLEHWRSPYEVKTTPPKTVGLVLAGNIPFVGLHDLLCVWLSGHNALIKCASKDPYLLPAIVTLLEAFAPDQKNRIEFTSAPLSNYDAVIATGSDNAARYFEYYFSGVPNIIRKNRNGVAVLTGDETESELIALGKDILQYFGLGCRNVAQLFLPKNYDLNNIFGGLYAYNEVIQVQKYANNYDYNKAVFLMSDIAFLENGFFMLREALSWSAPIASVSYTYYNTINEVEKTLKENKEKIQCVVSKHPFPEALPLGTAQQPQLWDYADGVDTFSFLVQL